MRGGFDEFDKVNWLEELVSHAVFAAHVVSWTNNDLALLARKSLCIEYNENKWCILIAFNLKLGEEPINI